METCGECSYFGDGECYRYPPLAFKYTVENAQGNLELTNGGPKIPEDRRACGEYKKLK